MTLAACGSTTPTVAEPTAAATTAPVATAMVVAEPTAEPAPTEELPTAEPEPPSVPPPSEELLHLRSGEWQWIAYAGPMEIVEIETPGSYRVTFSDDATFTGVADCNTLAGNYVASDGGDITITPGPMTLAACPEGSRSDQFVAFLGSAARYSSDGDNLILELMVDGGTMTFAPAGDAPGTAGPASEESADALLDALRNLTYPGPFPDDSIALTGGRGFYDDGSSGEPYVRLIEQMLVTGDLDGDGTQDALALLEDNSSGTGRFLFLSAVLDALGNPQPTTAVMLGDRIGLKSLRLDGSNIVADLISQGSGDAACCAGSNTRQVWALVDGQLVQQSDEELSRIAVGDLDGTSWRLVGFNGLLEPVPTDYTITAMFDDGQIAGLAACNTYTGSMSDVDGAPGGMMIGPLSTTQKACDDPFMQTELRYLTALQAAYIWRWGQEPGYLSLGYPLDDGSIGQLIFEPASESNGGTAGEAITVLPFHLGDSVLDQAWMGDSPKREMPVRLNGMIAAPAVGDSLPLAVLIHGSHGSGCASEDGVTEGWPCPDQEKLHYEGFAYLLEALARQGYVAIAINANPIYLMAYGEANTPQRSPVLFDLYMEQIAAAVGGESGAFGVDLTRRVDLSQLVILGHSQGGAAVDAILANRDANASPDRISAGQGRPVAAFLLAPAGILSRDTALSVPAVVILPSCDRDLATLEGQTYYEREQRLPDQHSPFASILLRHANHNRFNANLADDELAAITTSCEPDMLLEPFAQRDFLATYLPQFFDYALGRGGDASVLALDASQPAMGELFGREVLTSLSLPAVQRLRLPLSPSGATGSVTAIDCPSEFTTDGGRLELCRYQGFTQPGDPEQISVRWNGPGGELVVTMPEDSRDLTNYQMLHLRTAIDPLTDLNPLNQPQSFSLRLADGAGNTATVSLNDEPALAFPPGSAIFYGDKPDNLLWDSPILLSSIRVPLAAFTGVDLSDIRSIDLVFDQSDSGALFITDLEVARQAE